MTEGPNFRIKQFHQGHLKIWFDILTPKEVLFFEPMVRRLKKRHNILCTSRRYNEVTNIARIRKFPLKIVGRYGGKEKLGKLKAGTDRTRSLTELVSRFSPDLTVSFCSPEAARISYGLGINHIAFNDSPHHTAVMKLTLPLVQKLLIPWVIPRESFVKFGIKKSDIIPYRAIDAASISKREVSGKIRLPYASGRKTILIRSAEDQAAYDVRKSALKPIIRSIVNRYPAENIVVSVRYASQREELKKTFGKKIRIIGMSYDGKLLLEGCDVFVGSGGTMTAESAMLGRPTISYDAVSSYVGKYLVRKKLVTRERNPERIAGMIAKMLASRNANKERAKRERARMEDPHYKLVKVMKSM